MKKKFRVLFSLAVAFGTLTVFFANCSDVKIAKKEQVVELASIAKPSVSICSFADTQKLTDDLRVSFIVDMSGSNIRNTVRPGGSSVFKATDLPGDRLLAIAKFINEHPTLQYRIIPFSSQILNNMVCGSPFTSAGVAALIVQGLIQLQNTEKAVGNPGDASLQMKETMYNTAIQCAADALAQEPVGAGTPFQYKFFFVTDGEPTDFTDKTIMEKTVRDMQLMALSKHAASFQMIPVFYGKEPTTRALDTLRMIGAAGNWKNTANPQDTTSPLLVENVNQIDFDRLLSFTLTQQYKITEFNIVNLTARIENGKLLADSDMDGIPDVRDPNPISRRSNASGLLDGICERLGGPNFCEKPVNCSQSVSNNMKMSQCDVQALGAAGPGVDEDGDLIPDFIEFLSRTNPVVTDTLSDMDNDGLSNLSEIHSGTPVDDPASVLGVYTNQWSRVLTANEASTSCPANQDFWNIELGQLPTVPVQAYQDPFDLKWSSGDNLPLSHAKDENLFFIYYFQQSASSTKSGRQLRGKLIKLKANSPISITVGPNDFKDFGDPQGLPVWK